MRSILLARALRALPIYGFCVLLVMGIAQTFSGSTTVVAATHDMVTPPTPPAAVPMRLTLVFGHMPLPIVVPRVD
jgi:hypothetical protein